jgi:hypothetical protein
VEFSGEQWSAAFPLAQDPRCCSNQGLPTNFINSYIREALLSPTQHAALSAWGALACQPEYLHQWSVDPGEFQFFQATAKLLHARKKPSLLLKVDMAHAFNLVSWLFLLEVLWRMGFTSRWTNWVSLLLSTASTRAMFNGLPGLKICHGRGLRQGDPLSPILFPLVMEVISALF